MKPVIALLAAAALFGAAASAASAGSAHRTVHDPPSFGAVLRALHADEAKIANALQREQADAAAPAEASEPRCYNLFQNVDFDAVTVIAHFVRATVLFDRGQMQFDIKQMTRDIAGFKSVLADFNNDGVQLPGAQRAVQGVADRITSARSKANKEIDQMNHLVAQAYGIADELAADLSCPGQDLPRSRLARPLIPQIT